MARRARNAALGFLLSIMTAAAWGQAGAPTARTEWVLAADAVHPGAILHAALKVGLEANFHVQSNQPLDEFVIPTALTASPPAGIVVREVVYPKPVSFRVQGFDEPLAVFEQNFVIGVAFDVDADVKPGVYPVTAALQYQACNDRFCLAPTTAQLTMEITVVAPDAAVTKANEEVFEAITFSENPPPIVPPTPPTLPTTGNAVPTVEPDCDVAAELQGFTVLGTAGGYLGADEFIAFIDGAETGTIKRNVLEGKGPLAIILLVIIGGVLLNLTPCVLPLIPINLAIIGAGAQAGSRARGFALGGTYCLAMAAVYGVLGLIVTLTATSFGTINSTIWFNVGIAVLFVFLALAMFDVIAIDFTRYQSKFDASKLARRGKFALAFGMGVVSALLAGACVAPVVIQVVVYASDQYAKGTTIALALPFFWAWGWPCRGPLQGPACRCCPSPACGWCA